MNSVYLFIPPFRCKHPDQRAVGKLRLNERIQQSFPLKGWYEIVILAGALSFWLAF